MFISYERKEGKNIELRVGNSSQEISQRLNQVMCVSLFNCKMGAT